jgi:hypothetical protein
VDADEVAPDAEVNVEAATAKKPVEVTAEDLADEEDTRGPKILSKKEKEKLKKEREKAGLH